jgi:hypothetical protein
MFGTGQVLLCRCSIPITDIKGLYLYPCPNTTRGRLRVQHLMSKLMLRRQCSSRIRHQLVLSLHQATSPCIPENFSFKSANSLFVKRWRTADRKCPLPIPLRRLFSAEWYLSPSSAHKSVFLLYHFLVLTYAPSIMG